MADHIKYAVSMDVVDEYTTTNTASGDITNDVADKTTTYSRIHPKIKKKLSGNRKYNAAIGVGVGGWSSGDPAHVIVGTSATSLGTFSSVKGVFIKHSGYTTDAKTVETSQLLTITSEDGSGNASTIAVLGSGGAIILPFETATTPVLKGTSASGDIAVEVMGTN